MRMLVFDDFSYFTRYVGVPKMEGVSDAQQEELEQTQTRFHRLIDEADRSHINYIWFNFDYVACLTQKNVGSLH